MARDKIPSDGNEKTQRRVYVLPNELVERIIGFQNQLGLASEVEAARRLLDEALKHRDDFRTITDRLVNHLRSVRSLRDAAKEILVDHPLVTRMSFQTDLLMFAFDTGYSIEINNQGIATVKHEDYIIDFGEDVPSWASAEHPRPKKKKAGGGRMSDIIDDDIPF